MSEPYSKFWDDIRSIRRQLRGRCEVLLINHAEFEWTCPGCGVKVYGYCHVSILKAAEKQMAQTPSLCPACMGKPEGCQVETIERG